MQLKQVVLGIGERGDAAVRAHVTAPKVPSPKPRNPLRQRSHVDGVEYDHAAARTLGRLGWRAHSKGDLPGLELAPVVAVPKCQRKLQRSFVERLHGIQVTGDGVDASDCMEGHFISCSVLLNIFYIVVSCARCAVMSIWISVTGP